MKTTKKIKATVAQLDFKTDEIIKGTERFIGYFETLDEASFAGRKERKDNETVHIYNAPAEEEEILSALEIAEIEMNWLELAN